MWWALWGSVWAAEVTFGPTVDTTATLVVDTWTVTLTDDPPWSGVLRWSADTWPASAPLVVRASPYGDELTTALSAALASGDAGPAGLAAARHYLPPAVEAPAQEGVVKVVLPGQEEVKPEVVVPPEATGALVTLLGWIAEGPPRMQARLSLIAGQTLPTGQELRRDAGLPDPVTGELEEGEVSLVVQEPAPCPGLGPGHTCVEVVLTRLRAPGGPDDPTATRLETVERWWVQPATLSAVSVTRTAQVTWLAPEGTSHQAAATRSWVVRQAPPTAP